MAWIASQSLNKFIMCYKALKVYRLLQSARLLHSVHKEATRIVPGLGAIGVLVHLSRLFRTAVFECTIKSRFPRFSEVGKFWLVMVKQSSS
jgi:hypothetical protein